jgi:hypothetical protein
MGMRKQIIKERNITYSSDVTTTKYLLARNEKNYRHILKTGDAGVKLSPVHPITIWNSFVNNLA